MKNASSATYNGGPPPRITMVPRSQPVTKPDQSTVRSANPRIARMVLRAIHGQAIDGCITEPTNGRRPIAASIAADAAGTVKLSLSPRGSDSTSAANNVAATIAFRFGLPKNLAIAYAAAPPMMTNAIVPPQLLSRFHGSLAIGIAAPTGVDEPSPNAISPQAPAAGEMCQLKMRISAHTAAG